ncbi:MAG: hypothetical protein AAFR01_09030, partial [Pseudomonadota bacterium]
RSRSRAPRTIYPSALLFDGAGWCVIDAQNPESPVPVSAWADINISSRRFGAGATMSPSRSRPPD